MTWADWAKKFFSEPTTVLTMFTSGVLGFVIGTANGVIKKRHGGWAAFFASMATGSVIAMIVGLGVQEYIKSEAMRFAIIGFCAVISDDIWAGFQAMGVGFRTNPLESFFRVLDALRGRSLPPSSAPSAPPAPAVDPVPAPASKED